ncbi:unnamed protein product [Periconia digitata]|uniref:Uncharacterized protein n=1 Tax=Periconia digitata TaxID=1303443 RepID=A0A9W4UM78_9PLEO|nr:unnamed protein product [Periconia digitata]
MHEEYLKRLRHRMFWSFFAVQAISCMLPLWLCMLICLLCFVFLAPALTSTAWASGDAVRPNFRLDVTVFAMFPRRVASGGVFHSLQRDNIGASLTLETLKNSTRS